MGEVNNKALDEVNSNVFDDVVRALCERHSRFLIYLVREILEYDFSDAAKVSDGTLW